MENNMFGSGRKLATFLGIGCLSLTNSLTCAAQTADRFPSKAVTIVMPFPAGGMGDTLARLLGAELSAEWKQPVVVENKPGASGMIGNAVVARAAPDGYTLLVAITQVVQAPSLIQKMPYDIVKDFTPISKLANARFIFATSSGSEIKSLKDYVTLASKSPGKYNFGSYGAGTTAHIQGEIFNKQKNIVATHVPYKGAAPLINDMLGGHVALAFLDMSTALPYIQSSRLNVHAVSGTKRSPVLPNVPTFKELGYDSFDTNGWYGLLGPARMSPEIVKKINSSVIRIMHSPAMKKKLADLGLEPEGTSSDEFSKTIASDLTVWKNIINEAGVKLE
jgi:tripartite-type tricarboxylate transporter receptor subunit TctC